MHRNTSAALRICYLSWSSLTLHQMQTLLDAVDEVGGRFLLTADHGNAEEMYQHNKKTGKVTMDKHGKPAVLTSHTLNPVRGPYRFGLENQSLPACIVQSAAARYECTGCRVSSTAPRTLTHSVLT